MSRDAGAHLPLRIATVGFQGFSNVGDEAILSGIEAILSGAPARVTTIFSGPRPEGIAAFPAARRIITWRHLPDLSALRAMRQADLLVIAGGGIFNDHWPAVVPRYALWVLAARLAGARVAWIGVGVGPIRRRWALWLTRLSARASALVMLRDVASAELLGLRGGRIVPDPSLFNARPHPVEHSGELGLVVRAPTSTDAVHRGELIDAIVAAAAAAHERDGRPVVMTMAGETDRPFARDVVHGLERAGMGGIRIEALGPTPAAALGRLAGLSGLITVRLHGLLLGALAGVPTVPIVYDDKVRAAAERLGLGDIVVPLARVSEARLIDRLELAADALRMQALRERVDELRSERDGVAAAIVMMAAER